MASGRSCVLACLIVVGITVSGLAQKTKIGYDKSADFSKYKTYTWAKPDHPIMRPMLYKDVVATIDQDLLAKGLTRVEADGDVTLSAGGGIDFGYNLPPTPDMNAQMWYGDTAAPILNAPLLAQGSLILQFVDRSQGKMVWRGTVMQKLDPEQKDKALVLAEKAVDKLLKDFPPKR
jgi:hypothetical protein